MMSWAAAHRDEVMLMLGCLTAWLISYAMAPRPWADSDSFERWLRQEVDRAEQEQKASQTDEGRGKGS